MTCAACHTRQIASAASTTGSTAGRRSSTSRASSPISTPPSARCWPAMRPSRPLPPRCSARADAGRAGGAAPSGRGLVPALPHADQRRPADGRPGGRAGSTRSAMIFNRLTGLDLGPPPSLPDPRQHPARPIAPVRYPFLWNAPIQDQTQWPGFADNGNDLLGLARNLGEVYGVFGDLRAAEGTGILASTILDHQLGQLRRPGPARGPDQEARPAAMALDRGQHARRPGQGDLRPADRAGRLRRLPRHQARRHPPDSPTRRPGRRRSRTSAPTRTIRHPGLDRQDRRAGGRAIPFVSRAAAAEPMSPSTSSACRWSARSRSTTAPATAAGGTSRRLRRAGRSCRRQPTHRGASARTARFGPAERPSSRCDRRRAAARIRSAGDAGIWAAAPYLHNGSVPTLAELLKPAAERLVSFKVGPDYDTVERRPRRPSRRSSTRRWTTTDCSDRNSGNSRCGHDFGTDLSDGRSGRCSNI